MEKLTSIHNQHVKNWKKLQTRNTVGKRGHTCLTDGILVSEAVQSGTQVLQLIGTSEQLVAHPDLTSLTDEVYEVTEEVNAAYY